MNKCKQRRPSMPNGSQQFKAPSHLFYSPDHAYPMESCQACDTCTTGKLFCPRPGPGKSACLHCAATKTRCTRTTDEVVSGNEKLTKEVPGDCCSTLPAIGQGFKLHPLPRASSPMLKGVQGPHTCHSGTWTANLSASQTRGQTASSAPDTHGSRGTRLNSLRDIQTRQQLFSNHLRTVLASVAISTAPEWVAAFSTVFVSNIELRDLTALPESYLRERLALEFPDMYQVQRNILQEALRQSPTQPHLRGWRGFSVAVL
ncbi:hypothetical protein C8R43DRAFT_965366 [Mycena crocata]|nr:hypothetical protein C8R43DRAFT_965366 [Mycena crocata]